MVPAHRISHSARRGVGFGHSAQTRSALAALSIGDRRGLLLLSWVSRHPRRMAQAQNVECGGSGSHWRCRRGSSPAWCAVLVPVSPLTAFLALMLVIVSNPSPSGSSPELLSAPEKLSQNYRRS